MASSVRMGFADGEGGALAEWLGSKGFVDEAALGEAGGTAPARAPRDATAVATATMIPAVMIELLPRTRVTSCQRGAISITPSCTSSYRMRTASSRGIADTSMISSIVLPPSTQERRKPAR